MTRFKIKSKPKISKVRNKIAKGLIFDGLNEILVTNITDLNFNNGINDLPFSIVCRIRTASFINAISNLVCKLPNQAAYNLGLFNNNQIRIVLYSGSIFTDATFLSYDIGLLPNTNYHIVCTYDGIGDATGLKLYIDSLDVTGFSSITTAGVYSGMPSISNDPVTIGANSSSSGLFDGIIYEAHIYNEELSPEQILSLYNYKDGASFESCVLSNSTVTNGSFNRATMEFRGRDNSTNNNFQIWETTNMEEPDISPLLDCFIHKKYNAIELDGSNKRFEVAHDASLNFTNILTDNPFSISMWVKPTDLGSDQYLLNKSDNLLGGEYQLILKTGGSIELVLIGIPGVNSLIVTTNSNLVLDEWNHVTVTYNGSSLAGGINIYFNEVLQAVTDNSIGLYISMNLGTQPLKIGSDWNNSSNYQGLIGKLTLFSKELTLSELQTLRLNNKPTPLKSTYLYPQSVIDLNFGDCDNWNGVNWVLIDRSSNSNNANSVNIQRDDLKPYN